MHPAGKLIETRGIYELFEEIASGGMATVRLARWIGHNGFSRVVAVKQLYPQFARDSDFVAMFLDEARLSARVRHPNVVPILDIVSSEGDLFLVMDYVHGESVSRLHKLARLRSETIPPEIACTILVAVMHGLHAAHEARTEHGEPLQIIHRDVTPQNVLVGVDGCPRILDFGVAQAAGRLQTTRDGQLKGKLCYMAPEQLLGGVLDRRVDIYSASAMLWEVLAGRKLFTGTNEGEVVRMVLDKPVPAPSLFNHQVPPVLDEIVLRGLQREPNLRFSTAREMALAIEQQTETVPASEVGAWVERVWGESLKVRTRHLVEIESSEKSTPSPDAADDANAASEADEASEANAANVANVDDPGSAHGFRADLTSSDRSMINTRRIVRPRGLLPPPAAEGVVAAGPPPEGEARLQRRIRGAKVSAPATVTVAAVGVLIFVVVFVFLGARSSVRRSRDSQPGLAAGAGNRSEPREPSHVSDRREQRLAPHRPRGTPPPPTTVRRR